MTTTADDSLDAAAQLFLQHTTPTPPTTQTKSEPALSQSGSTSTPGIHTSHLTQASGSTTGKKNSPWLGANALCLVTIIYNSKSYQERKKLLLAGTDMLLEDMDASNLSYMSWVALSAKYPWFEKMHEMMNKCMLAGLAVLHTTPSLDVTGNEDSDHVLPSSDPMEESSDADLSHAVHAHNLPPIHDLVDAAPRNAGDYPDFDISTPPPHPIQLDALVSSLSTFSNQASPLQANGYKHKHINVEQKQDSLAEAFYRSSIESLSIHLKLAQEHTKQEAECTKQEELWLQHEFLYTMVHFSTKQDQLNSIIQTLEVSLPTELDQYAEELQDLHFDVDDYDSSPDTDDGPTPLSAGLICMYTLIAQQRYSVSQFHTGPLQKADRAPGPICHNKANPFLWLGMNDAFGFGGAGKTPSTNKII
ncbi:uncharacterized protein UBRO2_05292 [Ustilago bromivora]|uniref:Uncharacterized protein n=1 Tax=Ustilago bromivora TaxID=307758 RepID=A0A8H8QR80_9BASI|nr:uncharacterized protein UBRO2_05292 [Ustilago bromivora]